MKKIIMTLLAAITMTTAAQAQTQKMIIKITGGTTQKIALNDIEGITFDMEPSTADEARLMLVGNWVSYFEEENGFDGGYFEFRSDGTFVEAVHISSNASEDPDLGPYAGKFVLMDRGTYEVTPDEENPANGRIRLTGGDSGHLEYANLVSESFDHVSEGDVNTYNRVDGITYIEISE